MQAETRKDATAPGGNDVQSGIHAYAYPLPPLYLISPSNHCKVYSPDPQLRGAVGKLIQSGAVIIILITSVPRNGKLIHCIAVRPFF